MAALILFMDAITVASGCMSVMRALITMTPNSFIDNDTCCFTAIAIFSLDSNASSSVMVGICERMQSSTYAVICWWGLCSLK